MALVAGPYSNPDGTHHGGGVHIYAGPDGVRIMLADGTPVPEVRDVQIHMSVDDIVTATLVVNVGKVDVVAQPSIIPQCPYCGVMPSVGPATVVTDSDEPKEPPAEGYRMLGVEP